MGNNTTLRLNRKECYEGEENGRGEKKKDLLSNI